MERSKYVPPPQRYCTPASELGEPVETDVMIFGAGEPEDRSATKLGGIPFLSRQREWPRDTCDDPLPFLAQFNFRSSRDIVSARLDGELLLIFARLELDDEYDIEFVWGDVDIVDPVTEIPVDNRCGVFHASPWRTVNYPDALMSCDDRNLYWILGTQIGRCPFSYRYPPSNDTEIICSLNGFIPPEEVPYPLLNRSNPFSKIELRGEQQDDRFFKSLPDHRNCFDLGDSGWAAFALTICLDGGGELEWFIEHLE